MTEMLIPNTHYQRLDDGQIGVWHDGVWVIPPSKGVDYRFKSTTEGVEIFANEDQYPFVAYWDHTVNVGDSGTVTFADGIPKLVTEKWATEDDWQEVSVAARLQSDAVEDVGGRGHESDADDEQLSYTLESDGAAYALRAGRKIRLADGKYKFAYSNEVAYLYASGQPCGTLSVKDWSLPDDDAGTFEVVDGVLENWNVVLAAGARVSDNTLPDRYASLPALAKVLDEQWGPIGQSNQLHLQKLCDPADSTESVDFMATTKWLILGTSDGQLKKYLKEVAVTGKLRFVRYRTRPNVFSFDDVDHPATPYDFPATYTGSGGMPALYEAQRMLRELVATSPKTIYPYGDRNRVIVDFDEQQNSMAAQNAKDQAAETARAQAHEARLAAVPHTFDEMWASGDCWADYHVYVQAKQKLWELEFLVAAANYAQTPSIDLHRSILASFIEDGAARQVHLDADLIDAIALPANTVDAPSDSFDRAAAVVRGSLKLDFVNFRQWYANQGA